jgi:hypothetical protein
MKKVIMYLSAFLFGITTATFAQDDQTTGQKVKNTAKKTGRAIGKGAKKVGNKTAEYSVKGSAKVLDKAVDGKLAPNGSKVYVTEDMRYYWVDKKGGRHFVTEDQLKDKQ